MPMTDTLLTPRLNSPQTVESPSIVTLARRPAQNLVAEWLADDHSISSAERARLLAFRRWEDALSSLLARRMMIDLVAIARDIDPRVVQLERDASGRPFTSALGLPPVWVNAAHSGDWVAAALSTQGCIGVDLEVERPVPAGLAERCFVSTELAWLHSGRPHEVPARFFFLWTLKEALLKAVGLGLAIDPRTLCFDLGDDRVPTVREAPGEFDSADWRFSTWQPVPGVWLSVASDCDLPRSYTRYEDVAA